MQRSEIADHVHLRLPELRSLQFEEASEPQAQALRARMKHCEHCQSRLQTMAAEAQAFNASVNPGFESAAILQKLEAIEAQAPAPWWAGFAKPWMLAVGAMVALFAVIPLTQYNPEPGPTVRLKGGGVGLSMFVKDIDGVQPGQDGMHLEAGDQIQFRYDADGHEYLFIISVDARGVISSLYPEVPTHSIKVLAEGTHVLTGSIILDEAVGPERIYAIFSTEALEFEDIDKAVKSGLGDNPDVVALQELPIEAEDVAQSSILIVKD